MASLATVGTILGLVGTGVSAYGTIAAGQQAKANANFEATQMTQQATEERAAAQRQAQDVTQKTNLLLSRQRAVAAASGFGASDPTVQNLEGDVIQKGAYQAGLVRYGGDARAQALNTQAAATRASGQATATGSLFSAFGTLASGVGDTLFRKYAVRYPSGADTTGAGGSYYYG